RNARRDQGQKTKKSCTMRGAIKSCCRRVRISSRFTFHVSSRNHSVDLGEPSAQPFAHGVPPGFCPARRGTEKMPSVRMQRGLPGKGCALLVRKHLPLVSSLGFVAGIMPVRTLSSLYRLGGLLVLLLVGSGGMQQAAAQYFRFG